MPAFICKGYSQPRAMITLHLGFKAKTCGAMPAALWEIRGSEAAGSCDYINRLEKAGFAGPVWPENQMAARARFPLGFFEVSKGAAGEPSQH